ncbi:SPOR domain-containing protein [Thalassococcus lentus]|uniref:SPOR domain-containing protein n=1 Tax=Thalassococcus lentus TaxID=1210524 RepID=A0ABT4XQE0_9RHOB|nr:SPOR domain-containing protein [Thalassococcus lentus]MDA7424176.1 SPOR domain-containing protein [Thalassococcus lentus]
MTDYTYDGGQAAPATRNVASLANWAGATVSLALVIGVGVWGYKLLVRDVTGVPIVQAMEGPMRVTPEDPGGRLADHQGLAVNDVAGSGTTAPPADRLVLAPKPAGLSEEDVALGALVPTHSPMPVQASMAQNSRLMELTPEEIAEDAGLAPPLNGDDQLGALVAQLTADAQPLSDLAPGETKPIVTALDGVAQSPIVNDTSVAGGLARSLRPRLRPAGLGGGVRVASADAGQAVAVAAPAAGGVKEIDPTTLPAGTRLVQIGAFDSPETARSEWQRLEGRFGDYLDGKARVIQKASSGGRVFYRLRAQGFEDLSDARRFCAAFVAGKVDCIPVVTR